MEGTTRDVGTQSTPPELSSSSPSPASTPPILERSLKRCEAGEDSPKCNGKLRAEGKVRIYVFPLLFFSTIAYCNY